MSELPGQALLPLREPGLLHLGSLPAAPIEKPRGRMAATRGRHVAPPVERLLSG